MLEEGKTVSESEVATVATAAETTSTFSKTVFVALLSRWLPRTLGDQLDVLLKLTLIVGAIVAVQEYKDRRVDLRVARTLDYSAKFEGEEFRTQRARIREALVAAIKQQKAGASKSVQAPDAPDPALVAAYQSFDGKGIMEEVSEVTGFLNGVEVCIQENLCDERTSVRIFGPYAESFWNNFEPVVADQRSGDTPDFARETEQFVARVKKFDTVAVPR